MLYTSPTFSIVNGLISILEQMNFSPDDLDQMRDPTTLKNASMFLFDVRFSPIDVSSKPFHLFRTLPTVASQPTNNKCLRSIRSNKK